MQTIPPRLGGVVDWIQSHRTEVLLCLVTLLLYVPGIHWGLPFATSPERIRGYTAAQWLTVHLDQGSKLGYCGNSNNLPHTPGNVELVRLPDGASSVSYIKRYPPEVIVVIPDWTSRPGMEHGRTCSEQFFKNLQDGSFGYGSAAQFRTRPLIRKQLLDYPSVNPPIRIYVRGEKYGGRNRAGMPGM